MAYDDKATKAVTDEITAVDYKTNGAPFGEILINVCPSGYFAWRWTTSGQALFAWFPTADSKFLPLGDWAGNINDDPRPLLFAMSNVAPPTGKGPALKHPTDFEWVGDDGRSGNPNDICFWKPIAPDGYLAMGLCFLYPKPDPSLYWCVREDLCLEVKVNDPKDGFADPDWSVYEKDEPGGGGGFECDLYMPKLAQSAIDVVPNGSVLIPAPTFISLDMKDPISPYGLVLPGCLLPVDPFDPEEPAIVPGGGEPPVQFTMGLGNVVVVPYTAVMGDPIVNQPDRSPFYYFAAEPYYAAVSSYPGGTTITTSLTVGLSATVSETFSESTSLTLSADTGANFGVADLTSDLKFSAQIAETMGIELAANATGNTETEITVTITLPTAPQVYVWQNMVSIAPYRQDGTQMLAAVYQNHGTKLTPPSGSLP